MPGGRNWSTETARISLRTARPVRPIPEHRSASHAARAFVVQLQPPGKALEEEKLELAIHSTSQILRDRPMDYAAPVISLHPGHQLHERTPLPVLFRNSRTDKNVVLLYSLPVEA